MRRLVLVPTALSLLLFSGMVSAQAAPASGAFTWDAGAGIVCGVAAEACPDVANASNGDTISVKTTGTLNTADGSASGGGSFEHRNTSGDVVATGTLTATGLITFIPYGCGGGPFPPNLCGGRAALAVHLVAHPASNPNATVEADGLLEVTCLIGSPPSGAMEGIRLNVKDLLNFNKPAGGDTLFIKS
jgi:hypothetical protein